jgi:hypothetical protein
MIDQHYERLLGLIAILAVFGVMYFMLMVMAR